MDLHISITTVQNIMKPFKEPGDFSLLKGQRSKLDTHDLRSLTALHQELSLFNSRSESAEVQTELEVQEALN